MALSTAAEPVPFDVDEHGVARVGGTRVPLEVIIGLYRVGNTAEDLHRQFPSVELADIYAAIAYSLRHADEVEAYLEEAEAASERGRLLIESQPGYHEDMKQLKARLLERRRAGQ